MSTKKFTLNCLGHTREVFHEKFISFTTGFALIIIGYTLRKRVLTILTFLTLKWLYKCIYDSRIIFIYL